jgi:hypothetical protein
MSQIIDWIDQAYLCMYVGPEAAARLARMGIRGVIECSQIEDYVGNNPTHEDGFFQALSKALDADVEGARYFVYQLKDDPQVSFLELMWVEFGGT